jgi:hypothetical protein
MDNHIKTIFADYCGSVSKPVSAFRHDYTFAAVGVMASGASSFSQSPSPEGPSRDNPFN